MLPDQETREDRRRARRLKWEVAIAVIFSVTIIAVSWQSREDQLSTAGAGSNPNRNLQDTTETGAASPADGAFIRKMELAEKFLADGRHVDAALIGLELNASAPAHRRRLRRLLFDAHLNAREAAVLKGHLAHVRFAMFTGDGQRVFSGASDKSGALWRVPDGKRMATLEGHQDKVWAGVTAHDGRWVATAGFDGHIRLWEAPTGQLRRLLRAHAAEIAVLAVSADSRRIASASYDGTGAVWDAESGDLLARLEGHEDRLLAVAIAPDGETVATGGDDSSVRLWHAADGRPMAKLAGHLGRVGALSFSPDGQWLLSAASDGTARLWSVEQGTAGPEMRGHAAEINAARFSPDGQMAITASTDGTARLWAVPSGKLLQVISGHETWVNDAAFSPDSRAVATASRDRTIRLWSTKNGALLARLAGHENDVISVRFSPEGQLLVSGSADGTARLWDAVDGVAVAAGRSGERAKAGRRAFGAEGSFEVGVTAEHRIVVTDRPSGTVRGHLEGHTEPIRTLAVSPDGKAVLSVSDDGTVRLWRVSELSQMAVLRMDEPPVAASFQGDGRVLVETDDGRTHNVTIATDLDGMRKLLRARLPRRMTPYQRHQWGLGGPPAPSELN